MYLKPSRDLQNVSRSSKLKQNVEILIDINDYHHFAEFLNIWLRLNWRVSKKMLTLKKKKKKKKSLWKQLDYHTETCWTEFFVFHFHYKTLHSLSQYDQVVVLGGRGLQNKQNKNRWAGEQARKKQSSFRYRLDTLFMQVSRMGGGGGGEVAWFIS